jgi:hypothetical protein
MARVVAFDKACLHEAVDCLFMAHMRSVDIV